MTHVLRMTPVTDPVTGRDRLSVRGPVFDVRYNGELVVEGTHQPFLDGCRAIQRLGASGPVELWDHLRIYPRMVGTVDGAAKLTVREPASGGLRLAKWSEWSSEALPDAS
jgi:hypothetical protein